jgi:hypothetical protein
MDVSIIVVAWNVRQLLYDCLKSVFEQTQGIEFEVVYVDNASEDSSVEMVRKEFPLVIIIENDENRGFIRASNQGIKVAKGRYILLLNSDTVILENAIAKTVKFADENPKAALVGCKVFYPGGTLQRNCFMYPSILNMLLAATYLNKLFPKNRFFGRERMGWWDFDDVREIETNSGCYSLVRKEAIDQVGVMDERYFVYGDDPDWCFRFRKAGWKIMYTPEPRIIHYHGKTTKHMKREFRLQLFGSVLIFMLLHRGRIAFVLARLAMALMFLLRIPYWLLIGLIRNKERKIALHTTVTYLIGFWYCATNWRKLLMNGDEVEL